MAAQKTTMYVDTLPLKRAHCNSLETKRRSLAPP